MAPLAGTGRTAPPVASIVERQAAPSRSLEGEPRPGSAPREVEREAAAAGSREVELEPRSAQRPGSVRERVSRELAVAEAQVAEGRAPPAAEAAGRRTPAACCRDAQR